MITRRPSTAAVAILLFASASTLYAAGVPSSAATANSPVLSGTQMGHSPADGKSMRMMKRAAPASASTTPSAPVEYSKMDHSPADGKAMRKMQSNKPTQPEPKHTVKHSMMGHSPADAKAMRTMTGPEKTVDVEHGGTPDNQSPK